MGLFGFGGRGGKIERLKSKVENKWGQSAERKRAMEMLVGLGSEEAYSALLTRFTFRVESAIADEEEKALAYNYLLAAGPAAILPIERFVATEDGVYWPLKALKELAGLDHAVELLIGALDRAETISIRVNEQKAQLVSNLRDFPHPKVLARLKTLCTDPLDDVRIMAIDGILTYGEDEALEVVAARLLDPDESPRTKSVIFEQLCDLEWSLEPWREQLDEQQVLPVQYRLGPKGNIKRANQ